MCSSLTNKYSIFQLKFELSEYFLMICLSCYRTARGWPVALHWGTKWYELL